MRKILTLLAVVMVILPSLMFLTGVSGLDSPKTSIEITETPTTSILRTTCFDASGHKGMIAGDNGTAFIFEEYQTKWLNVSTNASISFYGSAYRSMYDQFYLLGRNSTSGYGIMDTLHHYRSGSTVRSYDIDAGHSLNPVSAGVTGDDSIWTSGREYVYESTSSSVSPGDIRCVDVMPAYISDLFHSGPVTLGSVNLTGMPAHEHISLIYSSANNSWDVRGSISGLQQGKADNSTYFVFDSGVNMNRTNISLTLETPSDGDSIDFNIYELEDGYPAGSSVTWTESDVLTPLKPMELVALDGYWHYYIDKDSSSTVSIGDIRISPFTELFVRYADRPDTLTAIDFNETEESGLVVGHSSQVYILTFAATLAPITGIIDVNFNDVTYVGGVGKGMYLAVGRNTSTNNPALYLIDAENSTFYNLDATILAGASGITFTSMDWSFDNGYGLAVGSGGNFYKVVKKGVFLYDVVSLSLPVGYSSAILNSVRWTKSETEAVICGYDGVMLVYHPDTAKTAALDTNTTQALFSVGVRKEASPGFTYIVGSAGTGLYYSYNTDTSSTITATVYYPRISSYGLKDEHGFDIDNKMTDVDSNISFHVQAYYEAGWSEAQVDIYAWYDNAGSRNTYDINETTAENCTRAIHLRYAGGSNGSATGTWSIIYPLDLSFYGFGKTVCLTNQSESLSIGSYEYHDLFLNVSLGPQMFRSLNDGMTYLNDTSALTGFNDDNTWNYQIVVSDISTGVNDTRYSEFGLYQYTSISITGSPSGAAPPGVNNVSLGGPSLLKYSSNTYYGINVSVTDLTDGAGDSILASNIGVVNWDGNISGISEIGYVPGWPIHFSAADTPIKVWGNSSTFLNPALTGNYTFATWPAFVTMDRPEQVTSGDIDVGRHLTTCDYIYFVGTGALDSLDYYYHTSASGVVEAGDIRLTKTVQGAYDYPAYSVVQTGDSDVGLLVSKSNLAGVTGPDGIWDSGEGIYVGNNGATVDDSGSYYRVTNFDTGLYWYLDIPVSTPEGTYTGVITYTIIHQ